MENDKDIKIETEENVGLDDKIKAGAKTVGKKLVKNYKIRTVIYLFYNFIIHFYYCYFISFTTSNLSDLLLPIDNKIELY